MEKYNDCKKISNIYAVLKIKWIPESVKTGSLISPIFNANLQKKTISKITQQKLTQ